MNEIITFQEINTIVIPLMAFCHTHIRGHHYISLSIMGTGDIGVAGSSFDTRMLSRIEDRLTIINVLIVVAITRYCIRGPFSLITHVTIEIPIIALY